MAEIDTAGPSGPPIEVVVPTVGRRSLGRMLEALGPVPVRVLVVDDRPDRTVPLNEIVPLDALASRAAGPRVAVLAGRAAGPASARNIGWRHAVGEWVAFLDDDVVPEPGWFKALQADLAGLGGDVGGSQGRITVPLPADRRPTDWERDVAGLARARWATADMAYRRVALEAVGGFDERFPRAYREDADLAARIQGAGWRLTEGRRQITHPVRAPQRWASVKRQAGNADDVLLRLRHGPNWRRVTAVGPGRRRRHLAVTGAGIAAILGLLAGRPSLARVGLAGWLTGTGRFAWERIAPGPRSADEVATMVATSVAIPPFAVWSWLAGWVRHLGRPAAGPVAGRGRSRERPRPAAVLLDRDGTLVRDVPYNADPDRVVAMPGASEALARLRAAGIPTAVVSNQSGIGRGLLQREQVDAVNRRIEDLLGPLGPWLVCPHGPEDGCGCRKPAPGLVHRAADALGVDAAAVAVIGDIGADVEAARRAGARSILVPTDVTLHHEIDAAPEVATDLVDAIERLLGRSN